MGELALLALLTPPTSDHFDAQVESSLRRSLPIITTPHAKSHLASKGAGEAFTAVYDLDFFDDILVDIAGSTKKAAVKVTGMPGKHVPPGVLGTLNDLVEAVSFSFLLLRVRLVHMEGSNREGRGVNINGMYCRSHQRTAG